MCAFYVAAASAGLSQIAQIGDGAFLGVALASVAVCSIVKFTTTSAALAKIRDAPSVQVADLRSIASLSDGSDGEHIFVVRGSVEPKYVAESNPVFCLLWRILIPNRLIPHPIVAELSKQKAVIYQRTKRFVYNGCTSPLRSLVEKEDEFSSTSWVPFVLTPGFLLKRDYVIVNMDGSKHPLPLVSVYTKLHPSSSKYTLLHALFGHENPVGILDQEKILKVWNDITAVGKVSFKDGIAEIKSCKDLPYFLSHMSKDEMLEDLNSKAHVLLGSGIVFGLFAMGVLSYAAVRNWDRWKKWRQHRRAQA